MKKLLASALMLTVVAGAVIWRTGAFFSDTETSNDNTFTAGGLDLQIDSEQHYNGMVCMGEYGQGQWIPEEEVENESFDVQQYNLDHPDQYPQAGGSCDGTWALTDLVEHRFFNFDDVKPGDEGENTISVHVNNNDAWACVDITNVRNEDNSLSTPEENEGDTLLTGELAQNMQFFAWQDDGDNVWEAGEKPYTNSPVSGSELLNGDFTVALAAPGVLPAITGGQTQYVGVAWCIGTMDTSTPGQITCTGDSVGNEVQTDSLLADISFRIEQARNNPNFSCGEPANAHRVGAALGAYTPPTEEQCQVIVHSGDDLQTKIDGASGSSVVCVEDGNYSEFTINKPLTVLGLVNPNTGSAKILPSGPSVNYLASISSSDVTVQGLHFDGQGTEFTGGQTAGVHIGGGGAVLDNVNVSYNIIENLHATGASAANKGIQFHDGSSSGSPASGNILSNSVFSHNVIHNITSDNKGGYGIQTVGELNNVVMSNNTISDITGAWGAGVAIDAWETDEIALVNISSNQIMDGIWDAGGTIEPLSVQIEHKVDQTGVMVNDNNIESLVHGGDGTPASGDPVNAMYNWWGDTNPLDDIYGPVTVDNYANAPYLVN